METDQRGTDLQPIAQRALDPALAGLPGPRIAAEPGVDLAMGWRWLLQPDVQGLLARVRTERCVAIREVIDAGAREAVDFLRSVIAGLDLSDHSRIRAAVVLLQRAALEYASSEPMSIFRSARSSLHNSPDTGRTRRCRSDER